MAVAAALDEAFEALTLIQTGKIYQFPVILFGRHYWAGLIRWIQSRMLLEKNQKALLEEDRPRFSTGPLTGREVEVLRLVATSIPRLVGSAAGTTSEKLRTVHRSGAISYTFIRSSSGSIPTRLISRDDLAMLEELARPR